MKRALAALALMLQLAACAHVNRAALAMSTAALACDWAQTRHAESGGWMGGAYEKNPILGLQPSARTIDVYFAAIVIANAAVWRLLPKRGRLVVPALVLAAQAHAINANMQTTGTVCGL